ncbi:hypothetical protein BDF22DRAFT_744108 [Syncephalis plumigaleata]|nr:hypothetical protein BDF22DRAFT_744108 [Syncephalis plumigaleata]
MYPCLLGRCDTASVYSLDLTTPTHIDSSRKSSATPHRRTSHSHDQLDWMMETAKATTATTHGGGVDTSTTPSTRRSSLCYMGTTNTNTATAAAANRRAETGQAALGRNSTCTIELASNQPSMTSSTTSLPYSHQATNEARVHEKSSSRSGLFWRRTTVPGSGNGSTSADVSLMTCLMARRSEKKSDRLLRKKKRLERAGHAVARQNSNNDNENEEGGEGNLFHSSANRRRHSADDTQSRTRTITACASTTITRRQYPAGTSRLERMLPELFYSLAEWLFADPVALVRVSHLSRRMRDQLSEVIWRQACLFWDARHLPKGWFSNWRDFFILFVCPTRFPKLQVLHDKGCATCHTACPITGQFRNNDRGLVPRTSRQRFDYSRNGNLLYCPTCKHKQRLPDDQDEHCTLCSSPTPSAYVRFRVVLSRDVVLRRQAEQARDRALASFGSAAAAAAWAVTTTPTVTTFAEAMPSSTNHSTTLQSIDHSTRLAPLVSLPTSSSSSSSSTSLPDRHPTTITTIEDHPSSTTHHESPSAPPPLVVDHSGTVMGSHRPSVPFSVGAYTTNVSSTTDYEDYDESRPTFWAQVWNDTVRCAQGIRFLYGRPSFIESQASICGDCVRTLARLGYGRLEVAVRHEGTWALSNER